jgi:uncharacterized protein
VLRVGVIADTHLPRFGQELPRALVEGIRAAGVDQLLHLGDWTSSLAADLLSELAPLDGVAGNNDPPSLVERFGLTKVVELDVVRPGRSRGHLGTGRATPERSEQAFADVTDLAVILFGHSHMPFLERRTDGRPWLLNPGSPTDKRRQPRYTWALLTLDRGHLLDAELRAYDDRTP